MRWSFAMNKCTHPHWLLHPLWLLDPNNGDAYSNRGVGYLEMGEYDRAIADCTEAIRLDPRAADFYFNRAKAYIAKGEQAEAKADWAEAKRLGFKLGEQRGGVHFP